ncbi:uncharacterized protein LOC124532878 [Vanessa cardui]|uniref:uncharacterized protein LOC124532878 n=1 Tax=Vanessa cardui TaxID=171605 RepID=UPI001F129D60|nr:uncharacterized protein LOC124532878 [Vanessa cardui]
MSVIIRLQNLPWSANALDIRNFFRGLSIPEGGVHIVGGELGDAFIAFSTDEDARQAMMLDGGKIKEIQVKLLLSSRSEMHKVIETARQSVPLLTLAAPSPVPPPVIPQPTQAPQPIISVAPAITPFSTALGTTTIAGFGIPGIGNPQEIPQPAVIEPPAPLLSPPSKSPQEEDKDEDKLDRKRSKDKERRRSRSRSRSRDRERKERKRERRDRSRSRERRRRDRSRSRDRRDRKRDRKDRSRSRDRSPSRRSRDKRNNDRNKSPQNSQERSLDNIDVNIAPPPPAFGSTNGPQMPMMPTNNMVSNGPVGPLDQGPNRFNDPSLAEAFNKLQELGKKRNPNAFQGEQNGARFQAGRGGGSMARGGSTFRRDGRSSRFEEEQKDCCVALRNAPNHTSYGDVRRFFPFMIDKHGIKMINDNMGRRTGNIFVRFCAARSKQLALQRKSNELKGAEVIVEALDDETYEAAVDSFLPFREDNDDEDQSLVAADGENNKKSFSVLKLTDLPNFVKEHDIMKAFNEFSLLSIQLSDCRITRTKIAYVQFVKADDAKMAFERKDSYMFGRRQATIAPVSNEEYDQVKLNQDKPDQMNMNRSTNDNMQEQVIPRDPRQRRQLVDNGPSSAGAQAQGAVPTQLMPNAQFSQNFGGSFQNPQFGAFPSGGNLEPRAVTSNTWTNRMSFPKQSDQDIQAMSSPMGKPKVISVNMEDEPLDCVLMKSLPREATDRTIVNFLADTGAVPSRIHLMLDANGLPSGDCFCEFRSAQEARKAATKHGQLLDGSRVTIDLVMRSVVEEALEGPKLETQPGILGNAPPHFMNMPRGGFMGRGQFRGRGMFDRGGYDRGGFRGGFDPSRGGFDPNRGGFRGRGGWSERGMRGFDRGRGRGFARGRGGFDNMSMPMPIQMRNDEEQDPALENFGTPGCIVTMENVPFRATVDDIMTFFSDFELTQDDIIRRYNERGQPTGDARVAFRTPFDAQRAIKTRHMNTIFDRRINLTIL